MNFQPIRPNNNQQQSQSYQKMLSNVNLIQNQSIYSISQTLPLEQNYEVDSIDMSHPFLLNKTITDTSINNNFHLQKQQSNKLIKLEKLETNNNRPFHLQDPREIDDEGNDVSFIKYQYDDSQKDRLYLKP